MFMQPTPKNYHVQYLDVTHHWSPRSEAFAGGDALLTALQRGWEVANTVEEEEKYWHADVRAVSVYRFTLAPWRPRNHHASDRKSVRHADVVHGAV